MAIMLLSLIIVQLTFITVNKIIMKLTGKIHLIYDTQEISDRFQKREWVLEYADNPMYPQYLLIQFVQDKTEILDSYQAGETVEVEINLKGREWTSPQGEVRYFNTLEAWRMKKVDKPQGVIPQELRERAVATPTTQDDLPWEK